MASRYYGRIIGRNSSPMYRKVFEARDKKFIDQYATPSYTFPTINEIANMTRLAHIWTFGDRFYKLAHQHYGDATYWWVIAYFNKVPLESDVPYGKTIYIPLPLDAMLKHMR